MHSTDKPPDENRGGPPPVKSVLPLALTIVLLDQTQQLVATGIYADGSTSNVTTSVTWSSSGSNHGQKRPQRLTGVRSPA